MSATKLLRVAAFAVCLCAVSGCAIPRIASEFPRTDQHLSAPVPTGLSRVVVFNSSNSVLYGLDHSGRMHVLIDARAVGSLDPGEYAQVFLPQGRHDVALRHRDMTWIETEHPVLIDRAERYLNVTCEPAGQRLEAQDQPPPDFGRKYRPVPGL